MRKKSLLKKGLVMMMVVTMLLCFTSLTLLLLFYRNAKESTISLAQTTHERMLNQIGENLSAVEKTINMVAFAQSVQDILQDTDREHRLLYYVAQLRETFSNAFTYSPYIDGIALYDDHMTYLISSGDIPRCADSLQNCGYTINNMVYSGAQDQNVTEFVYLYFPVFQKTAGQTVSRTCIGYVAFTLSTLRLETIVSQGRSEADINVTIRDQEGQQIVSSMTTHPDDSASVAVFQDVIGNTKWTLESVVKDYTLSQEMRPLLLLTALSGVMVAVLFFRMVRYYRDDINKPLMQIQEFMADLPDAHARITIQNDPKNELLDMMQLLNEMLGSLEQKNMELIETRTRFLQEETVRQQMELIAYRNQVNPHFLYNTMDCIRGIAFKYGAPEIVEITESLSHMFRYAVKGGDSSTIGQELDYVRSYARIIQYRFSRRITIDIEPCEALLDLKVTRMLLQPLVENAVIHGLERQKRSGQVLISIRAINDRQLRLRVEDNGRGIDEERLKELQQQIADAQSFQSDISTVQAHIGLLNIARRLYLHYGNQATLQISSRETGGAVIEIVLPIMNNSQEDQHV